MAENIDMDSNLEADFEDSGDESSFYGFEVEEQDPRQHVDDSDVDFQGIESEEDSSSEDADSDQENDEEQWTDQLTDFQVPDFETIPGINFPLPAVPKEIDVFSAFFEDALWTQIIAETNHYARQKLSTFPHRLAKFTEVTLLEMQAYFGIRIIMGMVSQALLRTAFLSIWMYFGTCLAYFWLILGCLFAFGLALL